MLDYHFGVIYTYMKYLNVAVFGFYISIFKYKLCYDSNMNKNQLLMLASVIFGIVAVLHLLRVFSAGLQE